MSDTGPGQGQGSGPQKFLCWPLPGMAHGDCFAAPASVMLTVVHSPLTGSLVLVRASPLSLQCQQATTVSVPGFTEAKPLCSLGWPEVM